MNRTQAAANARAVKRGQRARDENVRREILKLRREVGIELSRSTFGASGINLSTHTIQEEYVPELFTLQGRLPILDRMANDPVVRGQLNAITSTLISGVRWKVEGGTAEQQDLLAANLLREGDRKYWCLTSWNDRLYEALGCLIHGFSMFGKTREDVDGRTIFRELKWLHPRSLQAGDAWWMDDKDNLIAVRRQFRTGTGRTIQERIDANDLFLVPWDRRGPNWEGNAFIRPMYKPWKIREVAEKIDIIDLQNRGVGIPIAKLSAQGGVKERDALKQIIADLRGGSKERAFIVIGNDEEVKFLTSEGQAREAQTILDGKAGDIGRVGVTQYLDAGNTQSGSRAASSSMATGFFVHVDSIAKRLEDIFNFGAGPMRGLSEEIHDMNFEGEKEIARLVASRVSPTEQLDNIPLIGDMVQQGVIPRHLTLANEVLKRLGYPKMKEAEFEEAIKAPVTNIGGRPDGAGTDAQGRDDEMSRRFAGKAQKKTPGGGSPLRKSARSWPWSALSPS